jgi:hypothetical protein
MKVLARVGWRRLKFVGTVPVVPIASFAQPFFDSVSICQQSDIALIAIAAGREELKEAPAGFVTGACNDGG